jgi:hypothetical protein
LSNWENITVPDISKGTARPNHYKPQDGYHDARDPEVHQQVLDQALNVDLIEAAKALLPKPPTSEKFDTSLTREDQLKSTRCYGDSVAMHLERENRKGPKSVEMVAEIKRPAQDRKIQNIDFNLYIGREVEMKNGVPPGRRRDQGKAVKFERDFRLGEARCDTKSH